MANQANEIAARDLVWQSLGAVERKLEGLHDAMALFSENEDKLTLKLDAGLKGTADGVALAIAELRKDVNEQYRYLVAGIKSIQVLVVTEPRAPRKKPLPRKKK